jgi:cytochrome c biogenesis protein CcmG, thiol:disulfide interchange protein DsbE
VTDTEATTPEATTPEPPATLLGMPRRPLLIGTALAVAAAIIAGTIVALTADPAGTPTIDSMELEPADDVVGAPAAISYVTFDGEPANTGSYVGRPLVLNFFAEWCPPCVAEMPDFETVYQEVGDEIAFLGLSTLESEDNARGLIESTGITYDVGRDTDGEAFAKAGGLQMPTTVFIDAAGTVVEVHTGALTADQLRDRIDSLLRG